jgi:TolA-binding protein
MIWSFMMKPHTNDRDFRLLSLLLSLILGLSMGLRADAPPPPPFVNPDAPSAPSVNPGAAPDQALPASPGDQALPASPGDQALPAMPGDQGLPASPGGAAAPAKENEFNPAESLADSTVAAPTISDEQQIKNAMEMALELFHAEDYDACVKATTSIVDRYPKKKLYWVNYLCGLAQEHLDLFAQAQLSYEKVRKQAPHTTYSNAAAFRIGLCQLKGGQSEEAIYTLRDIIENNPRSEYRLQAYIHLGNLYRSIKDWHSAERIYKDIFHLYPNTSWAWTALLYLAETHAHQGSIDVAIRVYDTLLRNPNVPDTIRAQAQLRIGDLYIADERWLEALQTYRIALRDFANVPGVASTCQEKIQIATNGRKYGRVAYRSVKTGPRVLTEAPEDQEYRLKQEQEKVPYQ